MYVDKEITYESIIGKVESLVDFDNILMPYLQSQRILITGAGGSIGSRVVYNLSRLSNLEILATDRDENRLHSLSLDILGSALFNSTKFRVLDIRDKVGVNNMVEDFHPTLIVHAAALKHLAILEVQPREAYLTNFLGTLNLLEASKRFKVRNFLNISTDKAANAISILGKSKYMAEVLTALARREGAQNFTSVRFGNVFNSKGSVIETFTRQIKSGLPITLTDPEVERFFMKIEEAANLSLIASAINGGDVHVLDMGNPVKLLTVVERLMDVLGKKSRIEIVGLREGEKISEDLWSSAESPRNTQHPGISTFDLQIREISNFTKYGDLPDDYSALLAINDFIGEIQIDN
jgi:FlaA1/EpsC-like NDP-sugar epimerase